MATLIAQNIPILRPLTRPEEPRPLKNNLQIQYLYFIPAQSSLDSGKLLLLPVFKQKLTTIDVHKMNHGNNENVQEIIMN